MNKLPIDILKEINFINDSKELKNEITDFLLLDKSKQKKILIKNELEKKEPLFLKDKKYYRDLIFFSKSENVLDEIDLEIVFCNGNTELIDIWKYFKVMSSSANTSDDSFGCIKIMLKDKNTNNERSIFSLQSENNNLKQKVKFLEDELLILKESVSTMEPKTQVLRLYMNSWIGNMVRILVACGRM
jgi:hypothetical protein